MVCAAFVFPLSVSADNFEGACFTGVNFNWHSGSALAPSGVSGFNHYVIIYSSASTWGESDSESASYYILSDSVTSLRLNIEYGGCTSIQSVPSSIDSIISYYRIAKYRPSGDSFVLSDDTSGSKSSFSLSFNRRHSMQVSILTDLPSYDQNGNLISEGYNPNRFTLHEFLDDEQVFHYSVSFNGLLGSNDRIPVKFYVIDGSKVVNNAPSVSMTYDVHNYAYETSYDFFYNYFSDYYNKTLKTFVDAYNGASDAVSPVGSPVTDAFNSTTDNMYFQHSYHYGTAEVATQTVIRDFDIDDYEPYQFLGSSLLSHNKGDNYSACPEVKLNVPLMDKLNNTGGIYNYDDIAVLAVVEYENNKYVLRSDFSRSDVKALAHTPNWIFTNWVPTIDLPETAIEKPITDLASLGEYLRYIYNTTNNNQTIIYNNTIADIQAIDWHGIIGTGFRDVIPDLIGGLVDLFDNNIIDTDFDLPALLDGLDPLLPDYSTSLSDIALDLGQVKNEITLSTGEITTALGDVKNELALSVDDLSADIDLNARAVLLPDVNVCTNRLNQSDARLKSKFEFVSDVQDGISDIRDTIADSDDSRPDWHFTVFGKRLELVDWDVYEPYRTKIKQVFVAIAYVLLARYIFKTLPSSTGEDS